MPGIFLFYAIAEPVAGNCLESSRTNTRLRFGLCLWPPSTLLVLSFDSWAPAHPMKDHYEQQDNEINTRYHTQHPCSLHPLGPSHSEVLPTWWPQECFKTCCPLLSLQIRCLSALELGLRVKCFINGFETQ